MKLLMENWRNFVNEEEKEEELSPEQKERQRETLLYYFLSGGNDEENAQIFSADTLGIDLFKDKDRIEKELLIQYNTGLVEKDPNALRGALRKAKKANINIGEVVKGYKNEILKMLKSPENVPAAIELYRSVGMGNLLTDTDLINVDLRGADLSGVNLRDASLTKANLSGANLEGAILGDTDLSFANLSGANLSGADLTYATGINTAIGIAPEDIQNNPELYKNTKWPEDFYHEDY